MNNIGLRGKEFLTSSGKFLAVLSKLHCTCPEKRFKEKDEGLKKKCFVLHFSNLEPRTIEHLERNVQHICEIRIPTVHRKVSGIIFKTNIRSVLIIVLGAKVYWKFDKICSALLSKLHFPYPDIFMRIMFQKLKYCRSQRT